MQTQLNHFLQKYLNDCSSTPLNILSFTDSDLVNDPGNEYFFIAHLIPKDDDLIITSDMEPIIDIPKLNALLNSETDINDGDHCVTIETSIQLNSSILLFITALS